MASLALTAVVAATTLAVAASPARSQEQMPLPTLAPVVVESAVLPPERTRTEEQAREEIDRTPGGVEIVPQETIEESRAANLKDVASSWLLQGDGTYQRLEHDAQSFSAHTYFMTNPSLSGRGSALRKKSAARPQLAQAALEAMAE